MSKSNEHGANNYGKGDRVFHTLFQEGTVKAVNKNELGDSILIKFDKFGDKELMLAFASSRLGKIEYTRPFAKARKCDVSRAKTTAPRRSVVVSEKIATPRAHGKGSPRRKS